MNTESRLPDSQTSRPTRLVFLAIVAMYIFMAGFVLLVSQPDWTLGWIYVGLFAVSNGVFTTSLFIWNNELAWRRTFSAAAGTKSWDLVWLPVFVSSLLLLFYVAVRDFDASAGDLYPTETRWLSGLAIYVAGWTIFTWSGVSNPFFEKTVRIQSEQDHRVVDKGPYSIIRHPGYVGFIGTFMATPLLLPSSWVYVLSFIAALMLVVRTALEDHTLQAELPGYAEYATRVRFRLVPGVW